MATFAVTGFQRPRRKYYRPSYQCELEPIYEDPSAFNCQRTNTSRDRARIHDNVRNGTLVHNYEEIDATQINALRCNRPVASPSKTSTDMLNGMMSRMGSRPRSNKKHANAKTNGQGKCDTLPQSECAIVNETDGIPDMPDTTCKPHTHIENNNNLVNGLDRDVAKPPELHKGLEETNAELPVLDLTEVLNNSRKSSLYKVNGEAGKTTCETTTDENGFSAKGWPKLEPKPLPKKPFLCPAETKLRKRCFAACFVMLIILICVFVLAIIEGWIYTKTGTGFDGSDDTVFTFRAQPGSNTTDQVA